jgi:hypothetical protein
MNRTAASVLGCADASCLAGLRSAALAGVTLRYAAGAFLAFPGFYQTSNANFGSIRPAKGFRLLETEASHAEVTPRSLDLVQQMVDCLSNVDLFSCFGWIPLTPRRPV